MNCLTKLFQQKRRRIGYIQAFSGPMISKRGSSDIYYKSSSDRLLKYYKKKGIKIGPGTLIYEPKNVLIDVSRPELLEIGKHVFIHGGGNNLNP